MRLGIIAAVALLTSCASNETPALRGFDAIRAAIEVKTDSTGNTVTASSAPAATTSPSATLSCTRRAGMGASTAPSGADIEKFESFWPLVLDG